MMTKFYDGVIDVLSGLVNKRNASARSKVFHRLLSDEDMRVMYKSGLMSKVFRLKTGYAFNDTLVYETLEDRELFERRLLPLCKKASKYMLGFGRGIIVMFNHGDDLSTPFKPTKESEIKIRCFSGDLVRGQSPVNDLRSDRYYKPDYYNVRGHSIHHTRVVDFTYYEPVEHEKPDYNYGGISESELVYEQFINDSVVQRATGSIVDKASTFIYKIKGYKELISRKQESAVVQYVSTSEDGRSSYGALITDADDSVEAISQSITDLDKVDNITLRRISMVTGIGMTDLIGEQPGGLNANGADERSNTQDTVKNLQSDYLLGPINQLAKVFGLGRIKFKDDQMQTPTQKADYETKVIANAKVLWEIGEDYETYLDSKGVIEKDEWSEYWTEKTGKSDGDGQLAGDFMHDIGDLDEGLEQAPSHSQAGAQEEIDTDEVSLNGAQVTALLDIINKVRSNEIDKSTAIKLISASFPITNQHATSLLESVKEGEVAESDNGAIDEQ